MFAFDTRKQRQKVVHKKLTATALKLCARDLVSMVLPPWLFPARFPVSAQQSVLSRMELRSGLSLDI